MKDMCKKKKIEKRIEIKKDIHMLEKLSTFLNYFRCRKCSTFICAASSSANVISVRLPFKFTKKGYILILFIQGKKILKSVIQRIRQYYLLLFHA